MTAYCITSNYLRQCRYINSAAIYKPKRVKIPAHIIYFYTMHDAVVKQLLWLAYYLTTSIILIIIMILKKFGMFLQDLIN